MYYAQQVLWNILSFRMYRSILRTRPWLLVTQCTSFLAENLRNDCFHLFWLSNFFPSWPWRALGAGDNSRSRSVAGRRIQIGSRLLDTDCRIKDGERILVITNLHLSAPFLPRKQYFWITMTIVSKRHHVGQSLTARGSWQLIFTKIIGSIETG